MLCANRTIWAGGLAIAIGVALSQCTGCGGGADYEGAERAAVSGKVTLDGSPVPFGTVAFLGGGSQRRATGTIRDGTYSIPEEQGPNLGKYQVEIIGYEHAPQTPASTGTEGEEEEDRDEDVGEDEEAEDIDALGKQIVRSTQEVEIVSGENTCDFTLTSQ